MKTVDHIHPNSNQDEDLDLWYRYENGGAGLGGGSGSHYGDGLGQGWFQYYSDDPLFRWKYDMDFAHFEKVSRLWGRG